MRDARGLASAGWIELKARLLVFRPQRAGDYNSYSRGSPVDGIALQDCFVVLLAVENADHVELLRVDVEDYHSPLSVFLDAQVLANVVPAIARMRKRPQLFENLR